MLNSVRTGIGEDIGEVDSKLRKRCLGLICGAVAHVWSELVMLSCGVGDRFLDNQDNLLRLLFYTSDPKPLDVLPPSYTDRQHPSPWRPARKFS